jgi:NADH dehydrogenase FAD-containing subunit
LLAEMLQGTAVELRQGMALALRPERKEVVVETAVGERVIGYDYLVYALGSQVDRDSVPGARQWAYTLDGAGQKTAEPLHERLQNMAPTGGRVVVVGSGPTGVEIAGEIRDTFPTLTVKLVTAGEFGSFTAERIRRYMRQAMARLDIEVREKALVKEVGESEIMLRKGETVSFDLLIWAGGFKAAPLAAKAGLQINERNQVLVGSHLQSLSYPEIFAVGDAGFPVEETGAPYRMSLFTALVSAAHTADNLVNLLKGKGLRPFGF